MPLVACRPWPGRSSITRISTQNKALKALSCTMLLRLKVRPRNRFSSSRCDSADPAGTPKIGSAAELGAGKTNFVRIRALSGHFPPEICPKDIDILQRATYPPDTPNACATTHDAMEQAELQRSTYCVAPSCNKASFLSRGEEAALCPRRRSTTGAERCRARTSACRNAHAWAFRSRLVSEPPLSATPNALPTSHMSRRANASFHTKA